MSAKQTFAFCIDCWAIEYGIPDKSGVFSRDSGSSNHWDHALHVFTKPDDYPPPIRNVLACLEGGLPISDGRMEMFSLALAVTAIQPNNSIKVDSPRARAGEDYTAGTQPAGLLPRQERKQASTDGSGMFDFGATP